MTNPNLTLIAELAEAAYDLAKLDPRGIRLSTFADAQTGALVRFGSRGQRVFVTWAGTNELRDWTKTNLKFWPVKREGKEGLWHRGFLRCWRAIDKQVLFAIGGELAEVERQHNQGVPEIIITGHSLGGAMAILCAAAVVEQFPHAIVRVVTFGAPAVCSAKGAGELDRLLDLRRVRNNADIVPLSTLATGMKHFGWLLYFDRHGNGHENPTGRFRFLDRIRSRGRVSDHSMVAYLTLIRTHGAITGSLAP